MNVRHLGAALLAAGIALAAAGALAQGKQEAGKAVAIFAGGCFWCVESDFDKLSGVISTTSGYTGGRTEMPTYKQVSAGGTGHREAVRIEYDPRLVSYERLLHLFWRSVDPTDAGGQFCDRGESYETAIFAVTPEQRAQAEASKVALAKAGVPKAPIVTPIVDAGAFYAAEDYHQDYYKKNPARYKFYREGCGRDRRLHEVWGEQAMDGIPKS